MITVQLSSNEGQKGKSILIDVRVKKVVAFPPGYKKRYGHLTLMDIMANIEP